MGEGEEKDLFKELEDEFFHKKEKRVEEKAEMTPDSIFDPGAKAASREPGPEPPKVHSAPPPGGGIPKKWIVIGLTLVILTGTTYAYYSGLLQADSPMDASGPEKVSFSPLGEALSCMPQMMDFMFVDLSEESLEDFVDVYMLYHVVQNPNITAKEEAELRKSVREHYGDVYSLNSSLSFEWLLITGNVSSLQWGAYQNVTALLRLSESNTDSDVRQFVSSIVDPTFFSVEDNANVLCAGEGTSSICMGYNDEYVLWGTYDIFHQMLSSLEQGSDKYPEYLQSVSNVDLLAFSQESDEYSNSILIEAGIPEEHIGFDITGVNHANHELITGIEILDENSMDILKENIGVYNPMAASPNSNYSYNVEGNLFILHFYENVTRRIRNLFLTHSPYKDVLYPISYANLLKADFMHLFSGGLFPFLTAENVEIDSIYLSDQSVCEDYQTYTGSYIRGMMLNFSCKLPDEYVQWTYPDEELSEINRSTIALSCKYGSGGLSGVSSLCFEGKSVSVELWTVETEGEEVKVCCYYVDTRNIDYDYFEGYYDSMGMIEYFIISPERRVCINESSLSLEEHCSGP